MKSIGVHLKTARTAKRYSRATLSEKTKIKVEFIKQIEDEEWDQLPDYPVVSGFVKNIASALALDVDSTVAILRRDYPPKSISVNPKPDIKRLRWSPRLTFLTGIAVIFLLAMSYLGLQYKRFVSPPELIVETPTDGQVVNERILMISGESDPGSTVVVNNQPALLDDEGNFEVELEIFEGTNEIVVVAKSRSGKETRIVRTIEPELK